MPDTAANLCNQCDLFSLTVCEVWADDSKFSLLSSLQIIAKRPSRWPLCWYMLFINLYTMCWCPLKDMIDSLGIKRRCRIQKAKDTLGVPEWVRTLTPKPNEPARQIQYKPHWVNQVLMGDSYLWIKSSCIQKGRPLLTNSQTFVFSPILHWTIVFSCGARVCVCGSGCSLRGQLHHGMAGTFQDAQPTSPKGQPGPQRAWMLISFILPRLSCVLLDRKLGTVWKWGQRERGETLLPVGCGKSARTPWAQG